MAKRTLFRGALLVIALTGLAMTTPRTANADAEDKVTICHFPPGNPANFQEITVGASAVPAHVLLHEDVVGGCNIG